MSADHDPIAPESRPRLPRGVRLRDDPARGWLLLAPETIFEANRPTAEILKRCTGERTFAEIVDDLATAFATDRARIEGDAGAILAQLRAKRLIDL